MWRSILQTWLGRRLLGWMFAHMSFALPVARLRETDTLIAFRHPAPSYPVHILLVPKRAVGSLAALKTSELSGEEDFPKRFWLDVLACTQILVAELHLEQPGYRLIVNGGGYQDIPQLHVHLVSG
jgi:histidine triad (HIT) family protein